VRASVGDRIVIRGHRVGQPYRACEVLEVMGTDGGSPYVVRWAESGHETVFFPSPDATVKHFEHACDREAFRARVEVTACHDRRRRRSSRDVRHVPHPR
jgi:hypothetical protein